MWTHLKHVTNKQTEHITLFKSRFFSEDAKFQI